MKFWIPAISYRRTLYFIFAIAVLAFISLEIAEEFSAGESISEMLDDLFILVASTVIVVLFLADYLHQQQLLKELKNRLENSRGQLARLDASSVSIGIQYRNVMQKQFDQWNLTSSEQEIVVSLLKGLSFKEVAQLRSTTEKTVRQQASHVYRKSGLAGRHELAAWFFEDMLSPK